MPRLTSPLDNTSDAREALWNHYHDYVRKKASARYASSSSSPGGKKVLVKRRGASVPPPTPLSKRPCLQGIHNPEPRPSNLAFGTLWFGSEPDVDNTFSRWGGNIGQVPDEAVQSGIRGFEAGQHVATFPAESKTGLVHVVVNEMLQCRICPVYANLLQIQAFLANFYRKLVARDPRLTLPPSGLRTLRDRTEELEWVRYQAELRYWRLNATKNVAVDGAILEPSEAEVDALFDSYTHHSDLSS